MSTRNRRGGKPNQALSARLKEQERQSKYYAQLRRSQGKERDKLLLSTIKRSAKVGVYTPKEIKLTKYRRYRARQVLREYGEFLDPNKFFFVKAAPKAKKNILARAESLQIRHSRTGLFVPKEGHTRAKLRVDRKHKEYFVERSGRTKRGPTKGVRYRTITPLASIDELDFERDRLRRLAKKLGPLNKNERVTFKVIENGLEGYSHHTFSNVELLINHLEHYRKSIPAKINFFRHIVVEKTSSSTQWFAEHPATHPGRRGRAERDAIRAKAREKYDEESKKKTSRFRF